MARLTWKAEEVRKSLAEAAPETDTPDDDSAPLSSAKREAAKARHVSMKEASALLDRDRNTVKKWLDQGCPYVEKADRDLGKSWVLDLAAVVRWLEKRAADATAAKLGATADGVISEDEAKRRRAVAQAVIAEIEASEVLKAVVPVSFVIERISKDYGELRAKLMSLPDIIAGHLDAEASVRIRKIADEQVRLAIASMKSGREFGPSIGE